MKELLNRFNKKVLKTLNLKQFGLFFIAAFVFLMLSMLSETSVETVTFKIDITELPDDIQLKNDSSRMIKVRIKSSGYGLLPMTFGNLEPIVLSTEQDLKKTNKNQYLWVLGDAYENLQLKVPNAFEVLSADSDSIYFNFDLLASQKVPVVLETDVEFALGYDMKKPFALSQDSIVVIGPESKLDSINSIYTERLKLNNVKSDITVALNLINPFTKEIGLSSNSITVSGKVERFTEGSILVPVEVINIPKDVSINFFPKEISLNYYIDLESYNKITLDDFKIICDFQEHQQNKTFYLTPKLNILSEHVKSARLNNSKIDFIIL